MTAKERWQAQRERTATFERVAGRGAESRREARRETRLNWGKVLDCSDQFLCECLVVDRSVSGARLRLVRNIFIPSRFHFFSDLEEALYEAQIAWRRGQELGCRVSPAPMSDKSTTERRMSAPLYALYASPPRK